MNTILIRTKEIIKLCFCQAMHASLYSDCHWVGKVKIYSQEPPLFFCTTKIVIVQIITNYLAQKAKLSGIITSV